MKTNLLLTVAIGVAAVGAVTVPERPSLADKISQINQQINTQQNQGKNEPGKHEVVYLTILDGYRVEYSTNGPVVSVVSGPNRHLIYNASSSAGAPQYMPMTFNYSLYASTGYGVPGSYTTTNEPANVAQIIADLLNDGYQLVNYSPPNRAEFSYTFPTVLLIK